MDSAEIAALFDDRAPRYARDRWHQRYAQAFVAALPLRPGEVALDAGTGTGFAAAAIARKVAPGGRVLAVDLSAGMLDQARAVMAAAGVNNVDFLQADATNLPALGSATFDAVACSAGLLYMPVADALREWRRLARPGGLVAFSTMQCDSPSAGRLFRRCARELGLDVQDKSEALGTIDRCTKALRDAGLEVVDVIPAHVEFEVMDPAAAWEANLRSIGHSAARALPPERQQELRRRYLDALQRAMEEDLASAARADVLFALGTPSLAARASAKLT